MTPVSVHCHLQHLSKNVLNPWRTFRVSTAVLLNVTPCIGVRGDQQSGEGEKVECRSIFIVKMEALCPEKMPGIAYQTTRRHKSQATQTLSAGNENQLDALFILSLFRQSTSTCFGHICGPSSHYQLCVYIYIYIYTECPRRNVPDFGRVFLMLKCTDITQNTYVQSWTATEIMAREVWSFDSCYILVDYQIHIKTGRNMWFL